MGNLNLGGIDLGSPGCGDGGEDAPPRGEGPSRDANKHDNPAELTTFPEFISYNSAG